MPDLTEVIKKYPITSAVVLLAGLFVDQCSYRFYPPPPIAYECSDQQGIAVRYHRSSVDIVGEGASLRLSVLDEISSRRIFTDELQGYDCNPVPYYIME